METVAAEFVEVEAVATPVRFDFPFREIELPKKSRLDWLDILADGEWVAVKLGRGDLDSLALLFEEEGKIEVKGRGLGFGSDSVLVRLVPREFEEIGIDVVDSAPAEITRLLTRPTAYEQTQPVAARLGNMIDHLYRIKRARATRKCEYSLLKRAI